MGKIVRQINALISRIAKGDLRALDELYSLTSRMLLFMAKKYLYDKSYAEDLVSETYYKLVKNAKSFNPSQNGLNWLYKTIHNEAINFNIKDKSKYNCELNENIAGSEDCVDEWLDKILVQEALKRLTTEEKKLIYLRFWEGLDLNSISKVIDRPLTTTYDYLKRTLKKLKGLMK